MAGKTRRKRLRICFFHGLGSSPWGTKGSIIRETYPDCIIPKLSSGLSERLREAQKAIKEPVLLAGTSMGGLTAIQFAMENPEMVRGLVLMAPAVGGAVPGAFTDVQEKMLSSVYIPSGIPSVIIAGIRDEVIPLEAIHGLIERSPQGQGIILHEVEDDHDLHNHLHLMLEELDKMLARIQGFPPPL